MTVTLNNLPSKVQVFLKCASPAAFFWAASTMALELSTPCKRPLPPSKTCAISKSRTPSSQNIFRFVSTPMLKVSFPLFSPRERKRLTTTANVNNDIVFLGIKPLDNLGCQLGHEGGRGLIGLFCFSRLISHLFPSKHHSSTGE